MTRRLVALALLLAACRRDAETGPAFEVPLVAQPAAGDEVVATVDGRPITASQVATQARAAGVAPKEALEQLITAEVLAGEAARRGLDRDPEAREAARAQAVRRYLQVGFEREVTPASIPTAQLRRAYNANRNMFDHSTYIDVWHILTPVPKGATEAQKAQARAIAEEVRKRARGVKSAEQFQAIAQEVSPPPWDAFKVERVMTARDGWVLTSFSYPAFDQLKKPGDVSQVVETDYGYHVMYLIRFIPEEHKSLEEAAPLLRAGIFPEHQRQTFKRYLEEAMLGHKIEKHDERLPR